MDINGYKYGDKYKITKSIIVTKIIIGSEGIWEIKTERQQVLGKLGGTFTLQSGTICEVLGCGTMLKDNNKIAVFLKVETGENILVFPDQMETYLKKVINTSLGIKQTSNSLWNSKCKYCGADAYESLFSVECSKGCRQ